VTATESFLQWLIAAATKLRFLLSPAIRLSAYCLRSRYESALREKDPHLRATELKRLAALRRKIHPPHESYLVEARLDADVPLMVNICDADADIYYGVGFEHSELAVVKHFVRSGETFFDVGANIGVYTVLASRLVGSGGRVHAFEPLTRVREVLQRNVELNNATNVVLNAVAVGEKIGEEDLFVNMQSGLTSLGRTNRGEVVGVQKVPIWTLDDYANRAGVHSIDFLKIDVEGYEGHVLRGAANLISSSPDLIVLSELARKNFTPLGFSINAVIDWMRDRGFDAWMVATDVPMLRSVPQSLEKYPFQNFLFMRRQNSKYPLLEESMNVAG
jgi:FkbM family methyltransferase